MTYDSTGSDRFPDRDTATLGAWAATWGADPSRVQGPGANLSCKHDNTMRIKASGARLDAPDANLLWTDVDLRACRAGVPARHPGTPGPKAEAAYADLVIRAPIAPGMPRPSMELGMHVALTTRFVAHLHSLAGILLAAMHGNDPKTRALLEPARDAGFDVRRVPAVRPGLALTWAIAGRAASRPGTNGTLFLLAGHGVIWAADDPGLIEDVETAFEKGARTALGLDLPFPKCTTQADGQWCDFRAWPDFAWDARPAFPDFAVFFPDPDHRPTPDGRTVRIPPGLPPRDATELVYAQAALATSARAIGLDIALPTHVVNTVAALQLERLRRVPEPRSPK